MASRCFRCGSKAGTLNQVRMVLKATKLCTCRMLAATGWKLEYIPRVTSFQSEGEMTYRPRDGRPGVIQFEDAEKMEYHPHHPLQFIEKNTFFFLSFDMKGGKDYRSDCCFFAGEKDSHDSHSVGIQ